ncbi:hypothetical protein C0J52_26639, partial [Blattella germanica]
SSVKLNSLIRNYPYHVLNCTKTRDTCGEFSDISQLLPIALANDQYARQMFNQSISTLVSKSDPKPRELYTGLLGLCMRGVAEYFYWLQPIVGLNLIFIIFLDFNLNIASVDVDGLNLKSTGISLLRASGNVMLTQFHISRGIVTRSMGRKAGLSSFEQGQVKTYKDEGYSSREIARRLSRSPCVISNFLKLRNNYGVEKSTGRTQKLTPRQKRQIIRTLSAGGSSLGQLARDPTINAPKGPKRMVHFSNYECAADGDGCCLMRPRDPIASFSISLKGGGYGPCVKRMQLRHSEIVRGKIYCLLNLPVFKMYRHFKTYMFASRVTDDAISLIFPLQNSLMHERDGNGTDILEDMCGF